MSIYVKIIKKNVFYQDGQTDRRSTQNYSSEPHKTVNNFLVRLIIKLAF